jgi:hypothetical protein
MKFNSYLRNLNELKNMCKIMVAFSIDFSRVKKLSQEVAKILDDNNVTYEIPKDYHITIVQIPSACAKDEIVRTIHSIPTDISFTPKVVSVLPGLTTPYDYITVEYKKNDEFAKIFKDLSLEYEVIHFAGGTKPHITLFRVPKGQLHDDVINIIKNTKFKIPYIEPKSVELFNKNFKVEYEH